MKRTLFILTALALALPASAQDQPDGNALVQRVCAQCHMGGVRGAPDMDALKAMSPDRVLAAMETGPMISMVTGRSAAERRAIAEALTGKKLRNTLEITPLPRAMCPPSEKSKPFDPTATTWNGWGGANTSNTRFADAKSAGLTAADVPKLKLKWAFGFPGDLQSNAQATIIGGRVFVGSPGGGVYALSAATGCIHWYYQAAAGVRSAISVGRAGGKDLAFFGDQTGNVYALDAATGTLAWKVRVDDLPITRVSGSPTFFNGRLYVPAASGEEGAGSTPTYECCHFRGSVSAFNAADGKRLWKTYTIPEEPKPTRKNAIGTQLWGPAGAPVWSSPAIDTRRNALYFTTGNSYADPATDASDAFFLSSTVGSEAWNSRDLKSRPH